MDYAAYKMSPDFLMTYNIQLNIGKTLDNVIKNNAVASTSYGGVYGPATLNILKAMGWSSTYSSLDGGSLTSAGSISRPSALFTLILIASVLFY